jgi:hypothetical protein
MDTSDLKQQQQEEEEKSRLLNMCTYQRHKEEKAIEWFEEVKDVPLARRVGDGQLEERRRNVIRESDPMAMYAWKVRFCLHHDDCLLLVLRERFLLNSTIELKFLFVYIHTPCTIEVTGRTNVKPNKWCYKYHSDKTAIQRFTSNSQG